MEALVLKCPKCKHKWLYTGDSTDRVACPVCNAYVIINSCLVAAVKIDYIVEKVDEKQILERMEEERTSKSKETRKKFANRIMPELMKAVELALP